VNPLGHTTDYTRIW